jgi:hypothetical protein
MAKGKIKWDEYKGGEGEKNFTPLSDTPSQAKPQSPKPAETDNANTAQRDMAIIGEGGSLHVHQSDNANIGEGDKEKIAQTDKGNVALSDIATHSPLKSKKAGRQPAGRYLREDGVMLKKLAVYWPLEAVKEVKNFALDNGESVSDICLKAAREYIKRRSK